MLEEKLIQAMKDQEEYETRVLGFKCDIDSVQGYHVDNSDIYKANIFKGTRKEFDNHINTFFKDKNVFPYKIYYDENEINNIVHGHVDYNIISTPTTEGQKRKADYKYLKGGF